MQSGSISIIAAMSQNHVIGMNGHIPWHLKTDFQHFKELTTNHVVIMGRKTYESIGKPLPNRTNIIVTKDQNYPTSDKYLLTHSLEEALQKARDLNDYETFIIGGAEIYNQSMNLADKIYLTIIHQDFHGDTLFPAIDTTTWQLVSTEPHEENNLKFSFNYYTKIAHR